MGLMDFMKDVGEKLFKPANASTGAQSGATSQKDQDVANGEAIRKYIASLGLNVSGLAVTYDSSSFTATIKGVAADQQTKEKAAIAAGNVTNVAKVDDQMTLASGSATQGKTYTVKSGDTLSKISKEIYGDANQYNKIFEANKPMLKSADLIYPGQVLRLPD